MSRFRSGAVPRWRAIVIVGGLAAASCSDVPRRPLDPAAERDARQERRLPDVDPLDLPALVRAAFALRPERVAAAAELAGRRAAIDSAAARRNPTLVVTPERITRTDAPIAWSLGVACELLAWDGGRRDRQVAVAEQRLVIATLEQALSAWTICAEVSGAAAGWRAAARERELAEDEAQLREHVERLALARVAVGGASGPEGARATLDARRARSAAKRAAAQLAAAQDRLAAAIGVTPAELAHHRLELAAPLPAADALAAPSDPVDRLDLRVALAEYEAAERVIELELARQWPGITLGPGWQYDQGERHFQLGIGLELPLFDRNAGPIAEAVAKREQAAAAFRVAEAAAIAAMESARAELAAALDALAVARASAAAQQQLAERASQRVAVGVADRGEELEQRLAWIGLARDELAARSAVDAAVARLEEARQRPLDPRIESLVEERSDE